MRDPKSKRKIKRQDNNRTKKDTRIHKKDKGYYYYYEYYHYYYYEYYYYYYYYTLHIICFGSTTKSS